MGCNIQTSTTGRLTPCLQKKIDKESMENRQTRKRDKK